MPQTPFAGAATVAATKTTITKSTTSAHCPRRLRAAPANASPATDACVLMGTAALYDQRIAIKPKRPTLTEALSHDLSPVGLPERRPG
jgi:hypothetical protein